jgi:CxC5 like cysteine cluster associated with KDZ transposases
MSNLPGCNTQYYTNYYVRKDENTGTYHHTYYAHDPDFIRTAEHFFMERQLCELFVNMMVTWWYVIILSHQLIFLQIFCRTSATNCSQIYNSGFVNEYICASLPTIWDHRLEMTIDDVWNRFFIHSLLLDHSECNAVLQLDHKAPSQAHHLQRALQARNLCMRETGQEH